MTPDPAGDRPRSDPLRPTALEVAHGFMGGPGGADGEYGTDRVRPAPLEALEAAVLPALQRPPCLVSFSGGRDSSTVLAAATRAARCAGLDPPTPVTLRFADAPRTQESSWQEAVVRHLGLDDWELLEMTDEVDLLGPVATRVLRRHGVLFPPNAHLHAPMFDAAAGGSFLTGYAGDHLFTTWNWRQLADALARRRRPRPRDVLRLAHATFPGRTLRFRKGRRVYPPPPTWLRPGVAEHYTSAVATEQAEAPVSWERWVRWRVGRRDIAAASWAMNLLAEEADALLIQPLRDPGFIDSLARAGGRTGLGDRTAAMRALFGDALPQAVLERSTKATFNQAFWRRKARRFAESWQGQGVDAELVDPSALRGEWLTQAPDIRSGMLLQAAWLSGVASRAR